MQTSIDEQKNIDLLKARNINNVKKQATKIVDDIKKQIKNKEIAVHEVEYIAESLLGLSNHFKKQVFKKGDKVLVNMTEQNLEKDFYYGVIEKYGQKRIAVTLDDIDEWNTDWNVPIIDLINLNWGNI